MSRWIESELPKSELFHHLVQTFKSTSKGKLLNFKKRLEKLKWLKLDGMRLHILLNDDRKRLKHALNRYNSLKTSAVKPRNVSTINIYSVDVHVFLFPSFV